MNINRKMLNIFTKNYSLNKLKNYLALISILRLVRLLHTIPSYSLLL